MKNDRLIFLEKITAIENRLERLYNGVAKRIKTLPMKPGSQVYAGAAVKDAGDDAREIIVDSIMRGAEMGEEEAIREQLTEMKRRWE